MVRGVDPEFLYDPLPPGWCRDGPNGARKETRQAQAAAIMSDDSRKIRFGLWYDFRNPPQWRQSSDRLYREILDQIAWGENNGFDDVWLSEHHFIEDG
jgi:hypothetical protein